jgi:hypothetical protein
MVGDAGEELRSCSGVQVFISSRSARLSLGGSAASATLRGTRFLRTASVSARWRSTWMLRTVLVARPCATQVCVEAVEAIGDSCWICTCPSAGTT